MVFSKKVLTIFLLVIVVAALVYFFVIKKGADSSNEESNSESSETTQKKPAESPLSVKVAPALRSDLIMKLKSPGEAVTNLQVEMKAEVSGIIKKIHVKESQHVKKGDLLLELDDREHSLNLEQSEANRLRYLSELLLEKRFDSAAESSEESNPQGSQKAEADYQKASELFQKGLISQEEFEKATKQIESAQIESGELKDEVMEAAKGLTQAEVQVKLHRLTLEKTKIRAPFSGIITSIQVAPQEIVGTAQALFTLVNIDHIQVHAKVLESEVGKMRIGREVDLRFSAYPDRTFKGEVKAISPIITPEDKTCNVIIGVQNPDEDIKPGMHAEVEIAAEIYQGRLLVPQDAVLTRGGRKLVFSVEDGLAKWIYITIGLENEDYAEVLPNEDQTIGVEPGMQLIVDGHFTIAHDARVKIVE